MGDLFNRILKLALATVALLYAGLVIMTHRADGLRKRRRLDFPTPRVLRRICWSGWAQTPWP
jgi:hypothetical protein